MSDYKCPSVIYAGSGHQSEHPCRRQTDGPHHHHDSGQPFNYEWSTCHEKLAHGHIVAYTDFANMPPGHCDEHPDIGEVLHRALVAELARLEGEEWVEVKPNAITKVCDRQHAENSTGLHTGGFCRACAEIYTALNVYEPERLAEIEPLIEAFYTTAMHKAWHANEGTRRIMEAAEASMPGMREKVARG